ncbi:hypothetical protein GBA52_016944 [Prunus armeniaca]|nr:hypothetical protein GBA52_016944 [Prunus armeniaca]
MLKWEQFQVHSDKSIPGLRGCGGANAQHVPFKTPSQEWINRNLSEVIKIRAAILRSHPSLT